MPVCWAWRSRFVVLTVACNPVGGYPVGMELLDRITITPDVRSGKPCISGTRITVYDILEYMAGGMSNAEILEDFPSLSNDDLRAVLAFAAIRERRLSHEAA